MAFAPSAHPAASTTGGTTIGAPIGPAPSPYPPATAALAFDDAVSTPPSRFPQCALTAVVNDSVWLGLRLRRSLGFD